MGNQGKGRASYATLQKQMQAFDTLPFELRAALRHAYENWAPFPMQRRWQQGRYGDAHTFIASIRRSDDKQRQNDRDEVDRWLNRRAAKNKSRRSTAR